MKIYFDGREYVNTFWPFKAKTSSMWKDNRFLLKSYVDFSNKILAKTDKVNCFDISTGPVLAPIISISKQIKSIQLSDYCRSGRNTFLSTPVEYWSEYVREIIKLENKHDVSETEVKERINQVSNLIKDLKFIDIDLKRENIVKRNIDMSQYDFFTMHFVADSITSSKSEYKKMILKIYKTMRPKSTLLMSILIGSTEWSVGDKKYPSPNLSSESLCRFFKSLGFYINFKKEQKGFDSLELGHNGHFLVVGLTKIG